MKDTASQNASIKNILADLVGFPSISDRSNLDITAYVETILRQNGAECIRFPSPDGKKTNLLGTIGPNVPGGVVLSGHMDVVPVEGQKWTSDPFALVERGGSLFGRGSVDMKGFLATCLAIAPMAAHSQLKRPVHFAFSYDEEVGCRGVAPMAEYIAKKLPRPECVIVGEPTDMQLVVAHKGAHDWRTVVTGRQAHSSMPHLGAHAIFAGARLISFIGALQEDYRRARAEGSLFETPYPTLSVGLAKGGTAGNIIPSHFEFEWEARTTQAEQAETIIEEVERYADTEVLAYLRQFAPEAAVTSTPLFHVPPLVAESSGAAEALVNNLSGNTPPKAVAYCTEAGLFQQAGLSTVVYGPGSISQAHQPDEFISCDQLELCCSFLAKLVERQAFNR